METSGQIILSSITGVFQGQFRILFDGKLRCCLQSQVLIGYHRILYVQYLDSFTRWLEWHVEAKKKSSSIKTVITLIRNVMLTYLVDMNWVAVSYFLMDEYLFEYLHQLMFRSSESNLRRNCVHLQSDFIWKERSLRKTLLSMRIWRHAPVLWKLAPDLNGKFLFLYPVYQVSHEFISVFKNEFDCFL